MLDIDMESLDMDADAGSDQVEAVGTSAVGREAVNSRLLCRSAQYQTSGRVLCTCLVHKGRKEQACRWRCIHVTATALFAWT